MKNAEVTLAAGRTIRLDALRQWAVYSGLLEGLPTRQMNASTIEHILDETRERTGHEPWLIEPAQIPIAYDGRYPFGEPASLPPIACVADFISAGKDPAHQSYLTMIWFQHDYAFPVSPEAYASLLGADWERLARQHEL